MYIQKFRKKPVVISAVRVPLYEEYKKVVDFVDDCIALAEWCGGISFMMSPPEGYIEGIHIHTLEGTMIASPGDWIIKGVQGEFYPCKPDIFDATYEPTEELCDYKTM